ncbi:isoprenoid synthase domain-containing protein [Schizophyllum fasciatum]
MSWQGLLSSLKNLLSYAMLASLTPLPASAAHKSVSPANPQLSREEEMIQLQDKLALYIQTMRDTFIRDLSTSNELLTEVAQYYAKRPSKLFRPRLIFLTALAVNASLGEREVLPHQVRLAEIVEMIHVVSLLHDDVIDESDTRRGDVSAPSKFGNKNSILAGDFVLGRAMSLIAALDNFDAMREIAGVVTTLVEGEIIQAEDSIALGEKAKAGQAADQWGSYMERIFLKTGSLFARALRSTAMLSGLPSDDERVLAVGQYGTELGLAFQIIDDALDFKESSVDSAGKPTGAVDLSLGLITAPVFYALEERSDELSPYVSRKCSEPGDTTEVVKIVRETAALPRTYALAAQHAQKAREALQVLPRSAARDALEALTAKVLSRDK